MYCFYVISAYANLNVNFNDPSITYSQIQTDSIQSGRIEPNHEIKEDTCELVDVKAKTSAT